MKGRIVCHESGRDTSSAASQLFIILTRGTYQVTTVWVEFLGISCSPYTRLKIPTTLGRPGITWC